MRFLYEILLRVVGIASVYGGRLYVFVERMSRPKHHRFEVAPGFLRPCDKVIPQLVGMMVREQALERRVNGIDVGVLRLLEVYKGQDAAEHGRKGDGAFDFASAHFCLARGAGEHFVFDRDRFEFRTPQSEV